MDLKSADKKFNDEVSSFERLLKIVKTLRSENGCPWDKKQNPKSMLPCLVEETFETVDAVTENDVEHSKEELGDLFFNTLLVGYIFQQQNDFSVADVFNLVSEKILRRHPHVEFDDDLFCERKVTEKNIGEVSVDSINKKWNEIKNKVEGRETDLILDLVPKNFPPLLKGFKYLKKAASQGFEWPNIDEARAKIFEEMNEVEEAAAEKAKEHLEEEVGDLLLSVVNYSRLLGINPEVAMERADKKFYDRYCFVEKNMKEKNIPQDTEHLNEMEDLWKEAKKVCQKK